MNTKIGMVIALIGLALAPAAQAAEAPNPFANLRLGLFTHYAFAGGNYDHGRGWTHLTRISHETIEKGCHFMA